MVKKKRKPRPKVKIDFLQLRVSKKEKAAAPQPENNINLSQRLVEGALIGFAAPCLFLFLVLLSHSSGDPGWSTTGTNETIQNLGGPAGAWLADVFYSLFGWMAYFFPAMLLFQAFVVFRDRKIGLRWVNVSADAT